jgi:hypothetical protein
MNPWKRYRRGPHRQPRHGQAEQAADVVAEIESSVMALDLLRAQRREHIRVESKTPAERRFAEIIEAGGRVLAGPDVYQHLRHLPGVELCEHLAGDAVVAMAADIAEG